jgi:protein-disulfide isomerase
MLPKTFYCFFLIAMITFFCIPSTSAENSINDAHRKEVEAVVQDYIQKNPEVIIRAIQSYQIKMEAEKRKQAKKNLTSLSAELNLNAGSPVIGNPDGDVTIVEFFDYRCGYCKRVFPTIQALLKEDGNIRYVLKELPILGPDSVFASQAALAVWNTTPEKYLSFHAALMASRGNLTAAKIFRIAEDLALDTEALSKNMKNKSVNKELTMNMVLSERLNITGTPAFIIGDQLSPGAISLDEIKKMVAIARNR